MHNQQATGISMLCHVNSFYLLLHFRLDFRFYLFLGRWSIPIHFRLPLRFGFRLCGRGRAVVGLFPVFSLAWKTPGFTYQLLMYIHEFGVVDSLSWPEERCKPFPLLAYSLERGAWTSLTPSNAFSISTRPYPALPFPKPPRRCAYQFQRHILSRRQSSPPDRDSPCRS